MSCQTFVVFGETKAWTGIDILMILSLPKFKLCNRAKPGLKNIQRFGYSTFRKNGPIVAQIEKHVTVNVFNTTA